MGYSNSAICCVNRLSSWSARSKNIYSKFTFINFNINFLGLRKIDGGLDLLYAKYETGTQTAANLPFENPTARELFDTAADPWCTVNTYASADGGARAALDAELDAWFRCAGAACP